MFLVSNRSVGLLTGMLSLSAAWVWAPALFISSQKSFELGAAGAFWFVVPNALALALIGFLATKLKSYMPSGFTLAEFIKLRVNSKSHFIYIIITLVVQLYSLILHLTAINLVLTTFTNYNSKIIIVLLASAFLIIALIRGIRSSIFTDIIKISFLAVIVLLIIPKAISINGGVGAIINGLGGISGKFSNILNPSVFLTFGIAITVSLLSGAAIDQQLWQRALSIKKNNGRVFYYASVIFFLITTLLASLGFLAATLRINVASNQLVGYYLISNTLSPFWVLIFVFTVIITMVAAGSSALCAASSVFSVDIYSTYWKKGSTEKQKLNAGKIFMVAILIIATLISLIPNIQLVYLLLLIGAIRGSLLIPTIKAIYSKNLSKNGFFYGIVSAVAIGLPIFILGSIKNNPTLSGVGSLSTVIISFLIIFITTKLKPEVFNFKKLNERSSIKPQGEEHLLEK